MTIRNISGYVILVVRIHHFKIVSKPCCEGEVASKTNILKNIIFNIRTKLFLLRTKQSIGEDKVRIQLFNILL